MKRIAGLRGIRVRPEVSDPRRIHEKQPNMIIKPLHQARLYDQVILEFDHGINFVSCNPNNKFRGREVMATVGAIYAPTPTQYNVICLFDKTQKPAFALNTTGIASIREYYGLRTEGWQIADNWKEYGGVYSVDRYLNVGVAEAPKHIGSMPYIKASEVMEGDTIAWSQYGRMHYAEVYDTEEGENDKGESITVMRGSVCSSLHCSFSGGIRLEQDSSVLLIKRATKE